MSFHQIIILYQTIYKIQIQETSVITKLINNNTYYIIIYSIY
jgi:hypothetical protein